MAARENGRKIRNPETEVASESWLAGPDSRNSRSESFRFSTQTKRINLTLDISTRICFWGDA